MEATDLGRNKPQSVLKSVILVTKENQLVSVTEKPIHFLQLQGLACDWSEHNEHSRNIFSVHGFLSLSVKG